MKFYHSTTLKAALSILQHGFRNRKGHYLTTQEWSGVWLSNVELDQNEGCRGNVVLRLDTTLNARKLKEYEWVEEGKGYREWLVPAKLLNGSIEGIHVEIPSWELPWSVVGSRSPT